MKKVFCLILALALMFSMVPSSYAANTAIHGKISGKTVVHGLASLVIWPGLGQYLNDQETKKNWTHALLGITQIFRFWSGWDALIDRQGGRWDGKI